MSDNLAKAHRLIHREAALRSGGNEPAPQSVEKTVEFVTKHNLLADPEVRQYVRKTADVYSNDYYVATKLLSAVPSLVAGGFAEDALYAYKKVVRYDDPGVWYTAGGQWGANLIAKTAFTDILEQDRFLIEHLDTWGTMVISLFDGLLLEAQRKEWPRQQSWTNAIAHAMSEEPEADAAFVPVYDEPLGSLFIDYQRDRQRGKPHTLVAGALEKALRDASVETDPDSYSKLADRLIALKWSCAVSLPLQVLYDCIKSADDETWHVTEAGRLLSMPVVEGMRSISTWRRLLRSALPEYTPEALRTALLQTIRLHAPTVAARVCELWDIRGWGALTEEEIQQIRDAEEAGKLFLPRDPRQKAGDSEWLTSPAEESSLIQRWPVVEQRPLLSRLHSWRPLQHPGGPLEELEKDLPPKLEALSILLKQPHANDPAWKWNLVDWAEQALIELKRLTLLRRGNDPGKVSLPLADYLVVLSENAAWWQFVAEWALDGVLSPIPEFHRQNSSAQPAWGPSDPIFASLGYLDELIAVEDGEPFDVYRQRLGETLTRAWEDWPSYTRSVALFLIRDYHWHRIRQLSQRIDDLWNSATDPNVLLRCLDFILARPKVAARLRELLTRLGSMTDAARLANSIGQVLGDAVIRQRGQKETYAELLPIADLCDATLACPTSLGRYALDVAQGVVGGAFDRVGSVKVLNRDHADCWAPIATRSLEVALAARGSEDRLDALLQGLMSVLEYNWPDLIRTQLYDTMASALEQVLRHGSLGDFFWLHYLLSRELQGKIGGNESGRGHLAHDRMPLAPRDEVLVRFCRASAERVRQWSRDRVTTNDLAWGTALRGRDTAEMIRLVYRFGRDKSYLQRNLPPIIDVLGEAGLTDLATDLRLLLRRG